jgi:transglutaminase-like putative cysteine protease
VSFHDRRLWRARDSIPLFIVLLLHAWASGAWPVDMLVLLAILVGWLLDSRIAMSVVVERVIAFVCVCAGAFLGWLHHPDLGYGAGTLPRGASLVAVAALLTAASRLYVRLPPRSFRVTFVLGLVALGACGATRLGPIYGFFAVAYVASALIVMRVQDRARSPWRDLARRHKRAGIAVVAIASTLGVAAARALPHLYDAAQRALERAYRAHDVIGFSDTVGLGSLRDMLRSDEEVLRLSGDTDYLRGAVYDRYHVDGSWTHSRRAELLATIPTRSDLASPAAIRVRRISGDAVRYYLPLRARAVATEAGVVTVDPLGAVRVATKVRANSYAFVPADRDQLAVSPPTPDDLSIPDAERPSLTRIAAAWTAGAATPEQKLQRIHDHLKTDYAYSLDFLRDAPDPLLDFLEKNKLGYCTYFGSAMALLARAAGIPARLVAGYRVAERNPVTREYIVREDNAHAWAEVFVDDRWVTYDATPASDIVQNLPHDARLGVIAGDLLAAWWARFVSWLEKLTLLDLLTTLAITVALWILVRVLRGRVRSDAKADGDESATPRALPSFVRFEGALALRGQVRPASEPLEEFARRLEAEPEPALHTAAALLTKYAAFRYGGEGDLASLTSALDAFTMESAALPVLPASPPTASSD